MQEKHFSTKRSPSYMMYPTKLKVNQFQIHNLGLYLQGWTKRWSPGSVNMRRKIAFSCLLQAGERNFFSLYSQNLGTSF